MHKYYKKKLLSLHIYNTCTPYFRMQFLKGNSHFTDWCLSFPISYFESMNRTKSILNE